MCNFPVAQCQLAWKRLRATEAMVILLLFEYWMVDGALQICQVVYYSVLVPSSVKERVTLAGLLAQALQMSKGDYRHLCMLISPLMHVGKKNPAVGCLYSKKLVAVVVA